MKLFLLFFLFFTVNSSAQQQVLLRINQQGQQEAIPIKKGESIQAAIERITNTPVASIASPNGIVDKIKYYDSTATASNFGFNHQDVAFIWFTPDAGGTVKSIVWHNYGLTGDNGKAIVRAWKVDPRVATLPKTAGAGGSNSAMGYYVDADGDGGVTAFKDIATDKVFKSAIANPDSAKVSFDPLGTEATWLATGLQVKLDSAKWQGVEMLSWGDSLNFKAGELFGFTIQNASSAGGADARMEMWAYGNTVYPFHSYKFYEALRGANRGWHIRGDYEWQMYAVVEYNQDRAPKINSLQKLFTTLQTGTRTVKATVTDDNPSGGEKGVKSIDLYAKINSSAFVKSSMTGTEPNFTGTLPGANPTDTVQYYIIATDVNNNVSPPTQTNFYTIFKVNNNVLCMDNRRSLPSIEMNELAYYMMKDSIKEAVYYDTWNVKKNGTSDIPQLLTNYKLVNEVAGDGGYADLTSIAGTFLAGGTPSSPRAYILADQDHGFFSGFSDTAFSDNNPHAKYFGLRAIINQDYTNGIKYPWEINVDSAIYNDPVFGFIGNKIKKDTVKFWYDPNHELSSTFANWLDEITPTADATVLFRDKNHGNKVLGVTKKATDNSWYTYALMFDYLATDFRADTAGSLANPSKAPKYMWIVNAGHVMKNALAIVTDVENENSSSPSEFALYQNYPNPFNPTTVISYRLSANSLTTLKVYDVLGKEAATLVNEKQNSGMHSVTFAGTKLSTGVYFYRLQSGSFVETKKLLLLK